MEGLTDKVRTILEKIGITEPPVDVWKVAIFFGIKIIPYSQFPDKFSGTVVNQGNFTLIGINSNHSKNRQRFTIAHELGHFLLGHKIDDTLKEELLDRPINQEREADEFAGELLMPRDFLKKDLENRKEKLTIPLLAQQYSVSEQAMSIRLLRTGLINKM